MPNTLLDNNIFEFLTDGNRCEWFIHSAKTHPNLKVKDLGESLAHCNLLKNPLSIIEFSWTAQSSLNQELEKFADSLIPEIKSILKPYRKDHSNSSKDLEASKQLGKGLDKVWTLIANSFIKFYRLRPEITREQILSNLENRQSAYPKTSNIFLHEYNYVKYQLDAKGLRRLIEDLAIEAVSRYGSNLLGKTFPGDKSLVDPWTHHVSAGHFHFWGEKRNISSYRNIGQKIKQLNDTHKLGFFSATTLRPHDDTIDGYIVHALSMGWFHRGKALIPVFALTEDPFDEVLARVQQYQAVLAYYQNPLCSPLGATQRIKEVFPGTLFQFNRTTSILKMATFSPAKVIQSDGQLSIQCHYHPEEFKLD